MGIDKITDICVCERHVDLEENLAIEPYKVSVRIPNWHEETYLINLPNIKSKSNYLSTEKGVHPRKDCDFIIFSLKHKEVFLIELKSSQQSAKPSDIEEQLNCAKKWWEHLSFCMGIDHIDFNINKIVIYVRSKMKSAGRGPLKKLSQYDYYTGHGKNIILKIR